jgi:high-affinity Fe2+/Pb2+ permease
MATAEMAAFASSVAMLAGLLVALLAAMLFQALTVGLNKQKGRSNPE